MRAYLIALLLLASPWHVQPASAGPLTPVDLAIVGGAIIAPGLIDAHVHYA